MSGHQTSRANPEGNGKNHPKRAVIAVQVQSLSEIPVSRSTVDAALDPSAASLLPQCESNLPLFKQIQSHIAALKEQLTSA